MPSAKMVAQKPTGSFNPVSLLGQEAALRLSWADNVAEPAHRIAIAPISDLLEWSDSMDEYHYPMATRLENKSGEGAG